MSNKQKREADAAFAAVSKPTPTPPVVRKQRRTLMTRLFGFFLLGCAVGVILLVSMVYSQQTAKAPLKRVPALLQSVPGTASGTEGGGGYLSPLPDTRPRGVAPMPKATPKVQPLPKAEPLPKIRRDA